MGKAVGIDLGTTNSAVAVLRPTGRPEVLKNQEGDPTTASVVLFQDFDGDDEPLVGELAKRQAAAFPDDVIQNVKRFMGDPHWRFDSSSGAQYGPEEISAIILKRLKHDAEMALGETVTDAVITVPAYFDDARRTATKQAGVIAGLNVLRVLNEPTAAALSHGFDTEADGTVLVYDLGGGTFDVTILKIDGSRFEVLATDGDRNLGGVDWDNALMSLVVDDVVGQGAVGFLDDVSAVADLREKAEFAKKALSTMSNTKVRLSYGGKQYRVEISRERYESASASLLRRTEELVEDALAAAALGWADVDQVLLVGGSTRMPAVRELVQKMSGKSVELDVNPDEAVALGAAVHAAMYEGGAGGRNAAAPGSALVLRGGEPIAVSDVASQALGVITVTGDDLDQEVNTVVIPRNARVPSQHSRDLATIVANQKQLQVQVTQGDDEDVDFVTVVGECTMTLPGTYPKGSPLRVTYHYDIDQTIFVEVDDLVAGVSLGTFQVDRLANLSDADVDSAVVRVAALSVG